MLPSAAAAPPPRRRLLAQDLGDAGEGVHPAPARPRVVRHDHHDPADAAHAVRLRHQHQSAPSADRGAAAGAQRPRPLDPGGAREHQIFQGHRAAAQRSRARSTAGLRQGAVRDRNPGAISSASVRRGDKPAMLVAADATDPVASGSALGALDQVRADRARARPRRSRRSPRCRSRSAPTPATTRPARPSSTSCPAWSAPSSP